jgi:hypothetical protein
MRAALAMVFFLPMPSHRQPPVAGASDDMDLVGGAAGHRSSPQSANPWGSGGATSRSARSQPESGLRRLSSVSTRLLSPYEQPAVSIASSALSVSARALSASFEPLTPRLRRARRETCSPAPASSRAIPRAWSMSGPAARGASAGYSATPWPSRRGSVTVRPGGRCPVAVRSGPDDSGWAGPRIARPESTLAAHEWLVRERRAAGGRLLRRPRPRRWSISAAARLRHPSHRLHDRWERPLPQQRG